MKINKDYVKSIVSEGLSAQFSGGYSWSDMLGDLNLTKAEKTWAEKNLGYEVKEEGQETLEKQSERYFHIFHTMLTHINEKREALKLSIVTVLDSDLGEASTWLAKEGEN